MNSITVLLAEDHTIVRKGLLSLLSSREDIDVIGEAENGLEAMKLVEKYHPDIVLMDISMPMLNGLEATRKIKKHFPDTRVLILTMHDNEEYILAMIKAGTSGYIVKNSAPEELILAIQAISKGEMFFSPAVSMKNVNKILKKGKATENIRVNSSLTEREREVLQLIGEGHTNRKIAGILFISVKTVQAHRSHIMEKLHLHSTASLIKYAIQTGIPGIETK